MKVFRIFSTRINNIDFDYKKYFANFDYRKYGIIIAIGNRYQKLLLKILSYFSNQKFSDKLLTINYDFLVVNKIEDSLF